MTGTTEKEIIPQFALMVNNTQQQKSRINIISMILLCVFSNIAA